MGKVVTLLDRAVLEVTGRDAYDFLQGLITNDMAKMAEKGALMAALLTPQGKINYEFFIVPQSDGFLLDTPKGGAADLLKKLSLYKMRASVDIKDLSASHMVFWFEQADVDLPDGGVVFLDPRLDKMGKRAIVELEHVGTFVEGLEAGLDEDYIKARLALGLPEGGHDYAFGDSFVHEAGYDLLNGVDFNKGCYVGQEVVSRMHHRGSVRKRIVMVEGMSDLPEPGSEIRTHSSMIGVLGTRLGTKGLAMVRLDRAAKALEKEDNIRVEGVGVRLSIPSWAAYDFPYEES